MGLSEAEAAIIDDLASSIELWALKIGIRVDLEGSLESEFSIGGTEPERNPSLVSTQPSMSELSVTLRFLLPFPSLFRIFKELAALFTIPEAMEPARLTLSPSVIVRLALRMGLVFR